jgi:hypothetical protein
MTGVRFFPINKFIDVNEWVGSPYSTNDVFLRMIVVAALSLGAAAITTAVARRRLNWDPHSGAQHRLPVRCGLSHPVLLDVTDVQVRRGHHPPHHAAR